MDTSAFEFSALMGYPLDGFNFAIFTDRMFVESPDDFSVIDARKLSAWLLKRKCPGCAHQVDLMRAFNCDHVCFISGDLFDLGLKIT
ncbi:hypothetical protein [Granulicella tundricola]|uniref:Uncharacterized protein n=1 Tax=Granulicella tundricola (strain ATCC BAA-1859 / DSM 23138 / MP5ACTX9) TaxID=1198114 RepID=E8X7N7_GRATM|nr:hypothetical protein [Granulicella tundricola]ADW71471.1 hypothetical protein AciX9_4534 [Granulicella tundricola MP5ACTX9]